MKDENGLEPKQALFVKEYLIDANATQAAIRAGYSAKTAQQASSRLLLNVVIQKMIKEAMDKRAAKTELSAEYVINGLRKLVEDSLEDGERNIAVKGYELLGKHLKLFTDKHEHAGKDGAILFPIPPADKRPTDPAELARLYAEIVSR